MDHYHKTQLKVYTEEPAQVVRPEIEAVASLSKLQDSFRRSTGWSFDWIEESQVIDRFDEFDWLRKIEIDGLAGGGYFGLSPTKPDNPAVDHPCKVMNRRDVEQLADGMTGMLKELLQTQKVLWHREAELATGVPLVHRREENGHLAIRLESILRGGAEAVDADAAALYLLDEATSQLKLRSCWGLPRSRLLEPARPLQGSLADLEALLGHAVVLEDAQLMKQWNVPENFASAVCVPVSSQTVILGTIWIFSKRRRDFSDKQTGMIEVVSGRIAADLEREMLMNEGVGSADLKTQLEAASRWQRRSMPRVAPLVDGWEMSGWSQEATAIGGDFFNWFCNLDGKVTVALGDATGGGIEAALTAGAVKSALRAHSQYHDDPAQILSRVNLTIWTDSAGDRAVNLFCSNVRPGSDKVLFASAGEISVVGLFCDHWELLSQPTASIGSSPDAEFHTQLLQLRPGESLLIFNEGVRSAVDHLGRPLTEARLAKPLLGMYDATAEELVALARDRLEAHAVDPSGADRSILVLRRTD